MIELCQLDQPAAVHAEFDEYVPVTITWSEADRLLDSPLEVRCLGEGGLLELKFSPDSRFLVEVVLVNTPQIRRVERPLQLDSTDAWVAARWTGPVEPHSDMFVAPEVTAFDDRVLITFAAERPTSWVVSEPVLFGQDESGRIVAIGVSWNPTERDVVLSAQ